jgi:predicted DNA-binding transcriptional regulator YafY
MSSDQPWASRVLRLDALKALLAERDYTTVADLAEELGVSTRTLHRDLALLRGMGVPVEGDRGSGVGCTSSPGGRLAEFTSTSLRHSACCSASRSPKRWARRFCWTICAPSPARLVRPSRQLRRGGSSRCGDGSWSDRPHPRMCSPATPHPGRRSQRHSLRGLHGSAALVQYEDRYGGVTEREIELQFLYYSLPVWYAMAWDLLRDDIRSFRIDRIRHVRVLPITFRLRPPDPFLAAGEATARTI